MAYIPFSKWLGPDGIQQFIIEKTGCKPFSGAGINPRIEHNTTILKTVDDTYYYDDDIREPEIIKYTLFGHNGDQDESEKKFNEPLLNKNKTHHIYVYRVSTNCINEKYKWYGKYEIVDKNIKSHIGKDKIMRNIIILTLKRICIE